MRILIVGAGAIGGVTAARMARGGEDVTLLVHSAAMAERIRSHGLELTGIWGTDTVPLPAYHDPAELTGQFDCILLVTKAYDMPPAARALLPFLKEDGLAVSMQNGVCTDLLAEIVGRARTAAAVITFSSTNLGGGRLEVTGSGGFILGRADGAITPRLQALKAGLDKAAPTQLTDDILAQQLSKLLINSGITCGGAITGQTLGHMLKTAAARRFFIAVVREDLAVTDAMGIRVPPFGGKLDYYRFCSGSGPLAVLRRHATLFAVGLRYWNLTSSSLTSLRQGKPTEADYLNGYMARQGRALGVPTPVNDAVVRLAHQIEAGEKQSSPANLREILGC